jgi:crotonobetaine/carnitine-CoA ligase
MPHAQMHSFGQEVVSHAQFMAAYPEFVAGAAVVVRSKFSASSWVDHLRVDGTVTPAIIRAYYDHKLRL